MKVSEAIERRISVRAFRKETPSKDVVARIIETASRAPSGGNLQPWRVHVLAGDALQAMVTEVAEVIAERPRSEKPEYAVYPADLWEPLRTRRFQAGEDLYASIGIERENKLGRLAQFSNNFRLFGAPVGLFFTLDRRVGPPQWSDMGMFMQTLMLVAVEEGLDTCAQEAWSQFPITVGKHLELAEHEMLFSGMALGYRDEDHPINTLRTRRAGLDEITTFKGFD